MAKVPLLVVQDFLPSPVSAVAKYACPAQRLRRRSGTFVNHADLAQAITLGSSPAATRAAPTGQMFLDLLDVAACFMRRRFARTWRARCRTSRRWRDDLGEHGNSIWAR